LKASVVLNWIDINFLLKNIASEKGFGFLFYVTRSKHSSTWKTKAGLRDKDDAGKFQPQLPLKQVLAAHPFS
jgi:hypothetical protein